LLAPGQRVRVHHRVEADRLRDRNTVREFGVEADLSVVGAEGLTEVAVLFEANWHLRNQGLGRPGRRAVEAETEPHDLSHEALALAEDLGLGSDNPHAVEEPTRLQRLGEPVRGQLVDTLRDVGHGQRLGAH